MKKRLFLYTLLTCLLMGCELERMDYSIISPEIFLKNEEDAKYLVTACYNDMKDKGDAGFWSCYDGNSFLLTPEMTTDILTCNWGDGGTWSGLNELKYTPTTGRALSLYDHYNKISKYTLDIDRIENLPMSNEELKKRYIAEIKTIRAWLSYLIYTHFGPFPIASLEILKDPIQEQILPRATEQEMDQAIEQDLKDAIAVLPVKYDDADWGRFTKGAALTILMKFYMQKARWKEAETVGREIMGLGYSLMDNYADVFSKEHEKNNEVIYSNPCTATFFNQWLTCVLPYNYVTQNTAIAKYSGFRVYWSFYDTFEKGDKRLSGLLGEYTASDGTVYNRQNPGGAGDIGVGALPVKYGEDPTAVGNKSTIALIAFRYPDVLLLLAEAINRQNGPTAEALALVNQVRSRAGLADLTSDKYSSIEVFNETILLERGHELYCEGHRREDLIRHGKFIEYAKQRPNTLADEYKVLFPIPQKYINEGKGVVLQNPGY